MCLSLYVNIPQQNSVKQTNKKHLSVLVRVTSGKLKMQCAYEEPIKGRRGTGTGQLLSSASLNSVPELQSKNQFPAKVASPGEVEGKRWCLSYEELFCGVGSDWLGSFGCLGFSVLELTHLQTLAPWAKMDTWVHIVEQSNLCTHGQNNKTGEENIQPTYCRLSFK